MKRVLLLLSLNLSCSLLIPLFNADACEEASFTPSCEENILIQCIAGFTREEDCADLTCDAGSLRCAGCGDALVQTGEDCDGTNLNNQDCTTAGNFSGGTLSCRLDCAFDTTQCTPEICGNGSVGNAEACDDNNTAAGDGCAADCLSVEQGFSCTGSPSNCSPICGDGTLLATEICDDGNIQNNDGCSGQCQLEVSASCNNNNAINGNEICDGIALGGASCETLGYSSGTLACVNCGYNVGACVR